MNLKLAEARRNDRGIEGRSIVSERPGGCADRQKVKFARREAETGVGSSLAFLFGVWPDRS